MAIGDKTGYVKRDSKKRPGVVSKSKASKIKTSRNYLKRYRGQGK